MADFDTSWIDDTFGPSTSEVPVGSVVTQKKWSDAARAAAMAARRGKHGGKGGGGASAGGAAAGGPAPTAFAKPGVPHPTGASKVTGISKLGPTAAAAHRAMGKPTNPAETARIVGVHPSKLRELEQQGILHRTPEGHYTGPSVEAARRAVANGTASVSQAGKPSANVGAPSKTTAEGGFTGRTVPRHLQPSEISHLDELHRTNPKEYDKQLRKYAKTTGMDSKGVHAEVASHQLNETIAGRRTSPGAPPKGNGPGTSSSAKPGAPKAQASARPPAPSVPSSSTATPASPMKHGVTPVSTMSKPQLQARATQLADTARVTRNQLARGFWGPEEKARGRKQLEDVEAELKRVRDAL